jgi:hypothetical protein
VTKEQQVAAIVDKMAAMTPDEQAEAFMVIGEVGAAFCVLTFDVDRITKGGNGGLLRMDAPRRPRNRSGD